MARILQRAASIMAAMTVLGAVSANAQNWTGVSPSDVAGKNTTVYLWNVAKQCFLEKGGRWGTEAVLGTTTNGQAFTVEKSGNYYKLKTNIKQEGSTSTTSYITQMSNENDYYNYFVDQGGSNFTFSSTTGGYTISTTAGNYNTTYYMCAARNSSSSSLSENASIAINAFTSSYATNNVWKLVTETERKNYFSSSTQAGSANAGGTFFIKDYDFARKDQGISEWKITENGEEKSLINGCYDNGNWEVTPADYNAEATTTTYYTYTGTCRGSQGWNTWSHEVSTETTTYASSTTYYCSNHSKSVTLYYSSSRTETTGGGYIYYVGNGYADDSYQRANGGKWTANIHGATGKVYQTITVPVAGIYRIKCKGFTTAAGAAKLFATGKDSKTASQAFAKSDLDVTTATYVNAYEELNTGNYAASVDIFVDANGQLTFGVEVADGQANGWASFDDFELEYVGTGDVKIILDENKESVEYLNAQNNNTEVKKNGKPTIYLHRSFTPNVWNTIVLPFSLTQDEVVTAFGAGTKVSKFVGAKNEDTPNRLYFEAATGIEKDQLYLITPTIAEPTDQEEVTGTESSLKFEKGSSYYTLNPQNGFYREDYTYPTDGLVGGTDTGKETFTGTTQLEFKGTYKKASGQIPANSYLLYAGASDVEGSTGHWVFREKTSSSRAFRGWLQRKATAQGAPSVEIFINGVQAGGSETTGIMEALFPETTVSGNIYTIGGQLIRQNATSTEGLAKGIYIVGGKKVVVK